MSAAAIKAGEAFVKISANMDSLRAGLNQAKGHLKSFGSSLSGIGSAISGMWAAVAGSAAVGALAATVKTLMDVGGQFADMSARTGLAASSLIDLAFAAGQTGATVQDLEAALRAMAKNGLNVNDFEKVGQGIASIQDPTERAARAMEVFGKSGTRLLPMFAELNTLKQQSKLLGPALTNEDVKAADSLGDSFGSLTEAVSRLGQQTATVLAPGLERLLHLMTGLVVETNKFQHAQKSGFTSFATGVLGAAAGGAAGAGRIVGLPDFTASGKAAMAEAKNLADAAEQADGMQTQNAKAREAAEKAAAAAARQRVEFQRHINSLIQESLTPEEQFLQKQREIIDAMVDLQHAMASGMFHPKLLNAQNAGLRTALGRLQQAEAERLQGLLPKAADLQRTATFLGTSSRGTFSSAGARLLGQGGEPNRVEVKSLQVLEKIERNTAQIEQPRFT